MVTAKRKYKKKQIKQNVKSDRAILSTVITVRISEQEKERIDKIMMNLDIKRYSDIMRMVLHMAGPNIEYAPVNMQ
jgi:hypothetical protein